jgi:kumamolisin
VVVDGQSTVIGGTSAVAPLWAALIARLNQSLGAPVGDVHAAIYQIGEPGFRDITQGNNGAYQAGVGWDACTGLGSPNGQALLNALSAMKS